MNMVAFERMFFGNFDAEAVKASIIKFMLDQYYGDLKERKFVLGLSGGLDSSLVAALIAEAGIPLYPMLLPAGNQEHVAYAENLMLEFLGNRSAPPVLRNIGPMLDARCTGCGKGYPSCERAKLCRGNRAARYRMSELYDYASEIGGIVCGTENKSEEDAGYCTKGGDQVSDLEPIKGLVKTEARLLARSIVGFPAYIIDQAPSANLWQGQSDEIELGFTYPELDAFILSGGNPAVRLILGISTENWNRIKARIESTEFKRRPIETWEMPGRISKIA